MWNEIIKRKNKKIKENNIKKTYYIKFPFYVDVYKTEDAENDEPTFLLIGKEAYEYIPLEVAQDICEYFMQCEIHQFSKTFCKKVLSMRMEFETDGNIIISADCKEIFTDEEKEMFLKFISGIMSDGWGENGIDAEKEPDEEYTIRFWQNENWEIEYI